MNLWLTYVILIIRFNITKEETEGNLLFDSVEDIRMLQLAEKYINDNHIEPFIGVEHLSRLCCMSRTKFINLFQKVYGVSSFDYYQNKRLNIAYECMKSGKHSVGGVAQIIGYTGINNFSIAFKKEFGILPSELIGKVKYI